MRIFGQKVIEWDGIGSIPLEKRKGVIIGAIVHFMKKMAKAALPMGIENIKVQGHDTNLQGVAPVVMVMSDTLKSPDRGYEILFDEVDLRQSTSPNFEILDVTGGVTFYQHDAGTEAKLSKLPTTGKTDVSHLRFTGGFPILDDWLRFNQYYKIDELTSDTILRWWDNKATIFYALISALGAGINQAFATDDITTINNACAGIQVDLAAAGYAVAENPEFWIVCHPTLKGRLAKALASNFLMPNTNNSQIVWNVRGIINTTKVANTTYYVVLPGGKSKRGEWEDLNAREPKRNELVLGADYIWTGSYNGAIAEVKQFKRCALT
jgi:hypothetical protein